MKQSIVILQEQVNLVFMDTDNVCNMLICKSIINNNIPCRWKADKRGVSCVCVNSDGNILVTAGRTIKLWNISDHSLLTVRSCKF